jgi:CHAT domain-containing protein/tetratricopeptide (TPR) repeat protein
MGGLRERIEWGRANVLRDPLEVVRVLETVLADPAAGTLSAAETGGVHTYLALACETMVKAGVQAAFDPAIAHVSRALQLLGEQAELPDWTLARTVAAKLLTLYTPGDRRPAAIEEAIKILESAVRFGGGRVSLGALVLLIVQLADAYRNRLHDDLAANVERAIGYLRAMLDDLPPDVPPAFRIPLQLNLGAALVERPAGDRAGNIEEALDHYRSALAACDDAIDPATRAQLQQNLAAAYIYRIGHDRVADAGAAITACRQALPVFTRQARPKDWLWTMLNLVSAYALRIREDEGGTFKLDDAREVIPLVKEALTAVDRESDSLQWAALQAGAGSAYAVTGETGQAIASYRRALEVFRPETSSVNCRQCAANLGRLYASGREWASAADAYLLAIEALEAAYEEAEARWSRDSELARASGLYRSCAAALARSGRLAEAVEVAERGRSRALAESLDRGRPDPRLAALEPGLVARYREALGKVAASDRSRAPSFAVTGKVRAELAEVVAEIRRQPGLDDFLRAPGLPAITAVLEDGEALAYAITDRDGTVFLVAHHGPAGPEVRIASADDFTSAELSRFLTGAALDGAGTAVPNSSYLISGLERPEGLAAAIDRGLARVGQLLVAPLADILGQIGARSVVLIPTGLLSLVPLHAAPFNPAGTCLLDQLTVRFSPSARVLAGHTQPAADRGTGQLVAVVDPGGTLKWAAAECAAATALAAAAGLSTSTQAGRQATRDNLLAALAEATYVHVASHGRFDSADPVRSGLQLADRPLTLADLLEEDKLGRVDLVVASACHTGVTDFSRLPDEALGLPAGFLQAGASAAVATLWPVADHATALLMTAFYARLFGGPDRRPDPASALTGAQLWLRDATIGQLREFASAYAPDLGEELAFRAPDDRLYGHPYYWAPFVLVGR